MRTLTKGRMWCYALGQLGWSIISGLTASWLVYFYQPDAAAKSDGMISLIPCGRAVLGLFTIVGLITAGGRIFDAVTDPLVGNWSDKCRSPLGRRIPFMKYSAIPLGIVFVLVFCAPVKAVSSINIVWLFVFLAAYYFAITCYCTPYTSLLAELTHTQDEKLRLSTCLSLTFIVGTSVGYAAPVIWGRFMAAGLGRISAMRITFLILAVIATVLMLVPVLTIKERDYCDSKPASSSVGVSLAKTLRNKDFRVFLIQDVIYFLGLTMFQTGLPFFVTSLLKFNESMSTLMFAGLTALSLVFYPFIARLARRTGKKKLIVLAFSFFMITFAFTGISGPDLGINIYIQAALIVMLGSFPLAVFGICPQAVVADIAQSDEIQSGESRSGMFYAARTFAMKFGQGAAMLIFTSLATIGSETGQGLGYRIVAMSASLCCALGGVFMALFNEKRVLGIILGGRA